jgi:LuxR family transcriptional regulator, transcriptional regulator of spore coat protein
MEEQLTNNQDKQQYVTNSEQKSNINFNNKSVLTKREREIFELLIKNNSTREISNNLFIAEKTVRGHISRAMKKLNVKGRTQAIIELIKMGEISINKKGSLK